MLRRWITTVSCAFALAALTSAAALAGEVTGNGDPTGARAHANSACAYSGLNDGDTEDGQNVSKVQTPADAWRYYGLPKGAPGKLGLCRGGTN